MLIFMRLTTVRIRSLRPRHLRKRARIERCRAEGFPPPMELSTDFCEGQSVTARRVGCFSRPPFESVLVPLRREPPKR